MPEEQKPQAPTIEQVTEQLHRTQIALQKAMQQRDVVANEVIDLTVSVDQGRRIAQAQEVALATLRAALDCKVGELTKRLEVANENVDQLTTQLASRAQQRAGKKK